MDRPIYLDYNATTPVDPRVRAAMEPFLDGEFGNPSSAHEYGHRAHQALEAARAAVGSLLGAAPQEIVFTGGGSESDNLAITGTVLNRLRRIPHVISTQVEHPAVLNTLRYLHDRFGLEVTLLPVDEHGLVTAREVELALRPETVLVSVILANNEVGTLQAAKAIAEVTRGARVLFHLDAAQAVGKIPVGVDRLGADLLTVAGHKLYGPKGIGALYVRAETEIDPIIHGASQEGGLRAGTENIPAIVGLGAACRIAEEELPGEALRLEELRDELHRLLEARIPGLLLNGHPTSRLKNTLNVSLPGVLGQSVLDRAGAVAASTGSACHAGLTTPSPVLMAMGLSRERALGAVRLSLGRWSTRDDVERAAAALAEAYEAEVSVAAM